MIYYLTLALASNVRAQVFTPSDHVCAAFPWPEVPQFWNQAPPGAQQLTLPDFLKVPHFEHAMILRIPEAMTGVLAEMDTGNLATSSRSGNGRRVTCWLVTTMIGTQTDRDIDPGDPRNMKSLLASELSQVAPHSL